MLQVLILSAAYGSGHVQAAKAIDQALGELGIPVEVTTIEYFDGPHKINGVGTFAFLHDKLNFPAPESP